MAGAAGAGAAGAGAAGAGAAGASVLWSGSPGLQCSLMVFAVVIDGICIVN